MQYHDDPDVNQAFIDLADALCQFERNSGRRSTLVFVPREFDEEVVLLQDGKPSPQTEVWAVAKSLSFAYEKREDVGSKAFEYAAQKVIELGNGEVKQS